MKTFLFLDDWMIDRQRDLVRRMGRPQLESMEPQPQLKNARVIYDPAIKRYRCFYAKPTDLPIPGGNFLMISLLAESIDGIHWEETDLSNQDSSRRTGAKNMIRLGKNESIHVSPYDPHDPQPSRRYKACAKRWTKLNEYPEYLATSSDGLNWQVDWEQPIFNVASGSDCDNNVLFNPITGNLQCICRPACLDRRVALVESTDGRIWSNPRVILHPDMLDKPGIQFYYMSHFYYEDTFIGLMARQHCSQEENSSVKWLGHVDAELTYSYNGVHWNRTNRQPFVPRTEPDYRYGAFCIYPHSLILTPEGQLRIYSTGTESNHCANKLPPGVEDLPIDSAMICHTLRKDGFTYLEPASGWGYLATRWLIPRDPQPRINVRAPLGKIFFQISDGENYTPFPGFSFDDCIPITGDHMDAPLRWKHGKDLSQFIDPNRASKDVKYRVRLEIKLFQAELYALRWNCDLNAQIGYEDKDVITKNLG